MKTFYNIKWREKFKIKQGNIKQCFLSSKIPDGYLWPQQVCSRVEVGFAKA